MRFSVGTVAPALGVLATVGWLMWPHLESPPVPNPPRVAKPEIAESLLTPTLSPIPARNPFRLAGESDEPVPIDRATVAGTAKGQPTPARTASTAEAVKTAPTSKPLKGLIDRLRDLAGSAGRQVEQARRAQEDLRAMVDGKVKLSATSIHGRDRIAILNGRTYAEGEAIDGATGPGGPIVLGQVRPASVLLRCRGAQVEVSFPGTSVATGPPPPVVASAPVLNRSASRRKSAGARPSPPR